MAKLFCYSMANFNKMCADNGWNDRNMPENSAFISILSTSDVSEYYGYICHYCYFRKPHDNVIVLHFDDITSDTKTFVDGNRIARCISDEDSIRLVQFIDSNAGKDIYIHCMAGKSRSQAVVRYILDNYSNFYGEADLNPDNPCLYPNVHVKCKLNRALRKLSDENIISIQQQ